MDSSRSSSYVSREGTALKVHVDARSRSRSTEVVPQRRPSSAGHEGRRGKHRVRFVPGGDSPDEGSRRSSFAGGDHGEDALLNRNSVVSDLGSEDWRHQDDDSTTVQRSRMSLDAGLSEDESAHAGHEMQPSSASEDNPPPSDGEHSDSTIKGRDKDPEKAVPRPSSQGRVQRMARFVRGRSKSAIKGAKQGRTQSSWSEKTHDPEEQPGDAPLDDMRKRNARVDDETESGEDTPNGGLRRATSEAHKLVRMHTQRMSGSERQERSATPAIRSGEATPTEERDPHNYVPVPQRFRGGVLSSLLKLYDAQGSGMFSMPSGPGVNPAQIRSGRFDDGTMSPSHTPGTSGSSGNATPRSKSQRWYSRSANQSTSSLAGLVGSSAVLATPAATVGAQPLEAKPRPYNRRVPPTAGKVGAALNRMSRPRLEDEIRITVHIAEILSRQKYLVKLCRALMSFGAPTHRLEEYMRMTARVLEIEGQFLYIPGCMIMSFDDASTHTTEVKLVREAQGVDLGKLRDTHELYKEVVHDVIGVEEATQRLDNIMKRKQKHRPWVLVLVYGLASATVGPFAFQARPIDMPIAFALGSLLGILQLILAPKSDLYANVFEISAAVLTSFLARAFGSIRGGNVFCFSALAQSAIALILPGYTVLCGSLELQSKSIVAGSVRMVYAVIYSLFLGFGITIGTAIYGIIDVNASSSTTCQAQIPEYYRFLFVPAFTLCLIVINQAKWRQAPVMLVIAFAGYLVNFFSAKKFTSNNQVPNTLGALTVGLLGNLYSRLGHGVAAAALLPAIFVQVPSGLAASGSLVSGVTSANQLVSETNGTAAVSGSRSSTVVSAGDDPAQLNSAVLNVGYSMIQVAIGITVGLFLSALLVYPFGKRRSGLFSF